MAAEITVKRGEGCGFVWDVCEGAVVLGRIMRNMNNDDKWIACVQGRVSKKDCDDQQAAINEVVRIAKLPPEPIVKRVFPEDET